MARTRWMLVTGLVLTGPFLFAAEDPYPGWTTDQLKAEIKKLKNQLEELQPKTKPGGPDYSAPATTSGQTVLIDDFESDHPSFGTGWWEGGDQNKMGTTIFPDPYERLKGGSPKSPGFCAGLKGHLGPNEEPWTWANLSLNLGANQTSVNLTDFKALRFYTQGDGKSHVVSLIKASVKDYADFQAPFTSPSKWTQVTLLFAEFAQPNWGTQLDRKFDDVKSISFTPGLHDADYDFKIDDLEFLK